MGQDQGTGKLIEIPVDKIRPNSDNPRLTFRQGELDQLQESIRQYGIKVPLAVFRKGSDYILIDGERRWRCASKLNLKSVPALVQDEPRPLQNLLLMFNIHALREQWDLLTIALKLPRIITLLVQEEGKPPTELALAQKTGLPRATIRRCRLLTDLPKKYQEMLLEELKKPKGKQTISEDFFIEMEKALKTVERAMPGVIESKNVARDALIRKYKTEVIENLVDLRKVGKIARAETVAADTKKASAAIRRLIDDPKYSITQAWNQTVSEAYAERDIASRVDSLLVRLSDVSADDLDDDLTEKLQELVERVRSLLGADA